MDRGRRATVKGKANTMTQYEENQARAENLMHEGQISEAKRLLKDNAKLCKEIWGNNSEQAQKNAATLDEVDFRLELDHACELIENGKVADSMTNATRALLHAGRLYGTSSAAVETTRGILVQSYHEAKYYGEALQLCRQAVESLLKTSTKVNDRKVLAAQHEVAKNLLHLPSRAALVEAEKLCREVILGYTVMAKDNTNGHGNNNSSLIANSQHLLALVLLKLEKISEAEKLL